MREVRAAASNSIKYQPNIVLINAGNNDARLNDDVNTIGERMSDLIDDLQREIPGVTILLSTMLPSSHPDISVQELDLIDAQYHHIAWYRRYALGQKIILVDFSKPGTDWNIPLSLLPDGTHPNDEGFERMAAAWYQGILEAEREGMLTPPNPSDFVVDDSSESSNTCEKKYGQARGPITTQAGSGLDDGLYTHSSSSYGKFFSMLGDGPDSPWVFARLSKQTARHYLTHPLDETHPVNGGRYHRFFPPSASGPSFGAATVFWVPDGCIKRVS